MLNFIKSKKFILAVAVIALFAIGYTLRTISNRGSQYETEPVTRDSITEVISEGGNVESTGVIPVHSTTTGVVEEVLVENGSFVSEDDVLFKVKSTATKEEEERALANYLAAKNALESAESTKLSLQATMFGKWDTFKELAESDDYEKDDGTPDYVNRALPEFHIPEKEWLAAEQRFIDQEKVVQEKQVAASAAWRAYQSTQDSEVHAVLDGEIRNLSIAKGTRVVAPTATTISTAEPILYLIDNATATIIKVEVNENDIVNIQEGQAATIEIDALDNQTFTGFVQRVDTVGSSGDVVDFSVYIAVPDASPMIRHGMTADVDIVVAQKDNILTVPTSAVKPYQGGRAVRIVNRTGELEFIPVETGLRGDSKVEIVAGVNEGTEVVVATPEDDEGFGGGLF